MEFEGNFGDAAVGVKTSAQGAVSSEMRRLNKSRFTPMNKFQRQISEQAKPIYIYNVSPIHEWAKPQGQLGTVMIQKREKGQLVSKPYIVPGVVNRWYDKGLGRKELFQESGIDVAQDICGCSTEYPVENSNNNLMNFGVFITDRPFEELPKKKQEELLDAANERLRAKLAAIVLEADQYWAGPTQQKGWIAKIHREALTALNEMDGTKEDRPWAPIRHAEKKDDCKFCGSAIKPGVVVCPNCRNVLDEERYAKMQCKRAS